MSAGSDQDASDKKGLSMGTQLLGRELSNREFFIQRWEQEYSAFTRVFKALPANRLDYRPIPARARRENWSLCWFRPCPYQKLDSAVPIALSSGHR
jgi:hypothetical protein